MSYPKQRINEQLKNLAKKTNLEGYADIIVGKDIDGIKFLASVIQHDAPYISYLLNRHVIYLQSGRIITKKQRIVETIAHNIKIYNEIIPKLEEDDTKRRD